MELPVSVGKSKEHVAWIARDCVYQYRMLNQDKQCKVIHICHLRVSYLSCATFAYIIWGELVVLYFARVFAFWYSILPVAASKLLPKPPDLDMGSSWFAYLWNCTWCGLKLYFYTFPLYCSFILAVAASKILTWGPRLQSEALLEKVWQTNTKTKTCDWK